MDRNEYPALIPGWLPKEKRRPKSGNGLAKRYFGAKPDGSHGESKRGWAPIVKRFGDK